MSRNQLKQLDQEGLASLPISGIRGRELLCEGRSLIDFAGTNYLSFDFEPELAERGDRMARKWGSVCGWSRLEADPGIYTELEKTICGFTGATRALLSHTITMAGFSVIPAIAEGGLILADQKVHTVVWEACRLARDHGADLQKFRHQDLTHLEELLRQHRDIHPKLIAVDGIYSISTRIAPIAELQALCEKYNAWLYVDDAHGFGVLGQNPDHDNPHGKTGSGIIRHAGGNYRKTFYVTSFGKAFSTHTAFVTIPDEYTANLPAQALAHIYSAPMSPHTVGTVLGALELNERSGEARRKAIRDLVSYFRAGLDSLGFQVENHAQHPVVFVPIGGLPALVKAAKTLKDAGVLTGLRAYPVVPEHECGVRFAITSEHQRGQLDRALDALESVKRQQ